MGDSRKVVRKNCRQDFGVGHDAFKRLVAEMEEDRDRDDSDYLQVEKDLIEEIESIRQSGGSGGGG